jgi:hypothetical protein
VSKGVLMYTICSYVVHPLSVSNSKQGMVCMVYMVLRRSVTRRPFVPAIRPFGVLSQKLTESCDKQRGLWYVVDNEI